MTGKAVYNMSMTEYTLIRSNRKSIAIHVSAAGVQVRAPLKASKRDIDAFVNRKERWIEEKLEELRARENLRVSHVLNYGAPAPYRGKEYPVSARKGNHVGFDMEAFYMPPGLSPGEKPCGKTAEKYDEKYRIYRSLYPALKQSFKDMA